MKGMSADKLLRAVARGGEASLKKICPPPDEISSLTLKLSLKKLKLLEIKP